MSCPNATLALASPPIGYDDWKRVLDRICRNRLSLSLYDLPALPTREAYDARTGPAVFFEETVLPTLRKMHGAFVDELLSETGDHEDPMGDPAPEGD